MKGVGICLKPRTSDIAMHVQVARLPRILLKCPIVVTAKL